MSSFKEETYTESYSKVLNVFSACKQDVANCTTKRATVSIKPWV